MLKSITKKKSFPFHYCYKRNGFSSQLGFSLIELIVFLLVMALMSVSLAGVIREVSHSINDPVVEKRMNELAQSLMGEIVSRRYDENSLEAGPPCGLVFACAGFGLESGENIGNLSRLDDIDDFNGYEDTLTDGYTRSVGVEFSGARFAIANENAKRIDIRVVSNTGKELLLTHYQFND